MKIFYVTPYAPNPIRVRPYNLIRHLVKRGNQVSVYTLFTDNAEWEDIESLRTQCRVVAFGISNRDSIVNSIRALPTREPLQSVYSWQPKLARKILTDIIEEKPDIIHVEHLRGARYGIFIKDHSHRLTHTPPIVWDSVDCISDLFNQAIKDNSPLKQRILLWLELPRTRRFEREALVLFDRVLVTSQKDAQALSALDNHRNKVGSIIVLPNGVDLDTFKQQAETIKEKNTLIVSGKMSYHANIAMTLYLVHEIMPNIWKKKPDVKLWIVGKDPPREIRTLGKNPLIKVTGMVTDIADYLRRATIAIAPLRYGAGIQNKILEAMACGTSVVTNTRAIGSLSVKEGRELLIANDPMGFADAITSLLDDDVKREEIGMAGRRYVETHHNWMNIASQLEAVYRTVIENENSNLRFVQQGIRYGN